MDKRSIIAYVMMGACFVVFSAAAVIGVLFPEKAVSPAMPLLAILGMFILAFTALRLADDPDHVKARQSNQTLDLASKTVTFMRQGLNLESAQAVCELLLPAITADAVAITNREKVLGFAGANRDEHEPNSLIQTDMTRETLEDGVTRVGTTPDEVGFKRNAEKLKAGIVTALDVNDHIVGTLKFYYKSSRRLNENQLAMAEGFAQLLSTQLSLSYLQQQMELTARMELKALQAQINPHFLFNTINTIAAVTRTDAAKARTMLREFAIYYRRLLENSEDLIPLEKEVEQTERYLMFQKARFGEDQIIMETDIEPGLESLDIPSFIMQPIVENAVGHGRREEGVLHIKLRVYHASHSVIIAIADDGVGISPERLGTLVESGSSTGMGIALKNVDARLKACFGAISGLYIDSELDKGTTVYLSLYDALVPLVEEQEPIHIDEVVEGTRIPTPKSKNALPYLDSTL